MPASVAAQSCIQKRGIAVSIVHTRTNIARRSKGRKSAMAERVARIFETWKQKARQLKAEVYALYLAYRDPRVPWFARVFTACVVAYAFSPIDLIPDFIPILGYLDDLILLPLGIKFALSMIPVEVMLESRAKAQQIMDEGKPVNWVAAAFIILIWLLFVVLAVTFFVKRFSGGK
jgi:uncharacterized membrane protein YkvA (DUF1232 family)